MRSGISSTTVSKNLVKSHKIYLEHALIIKKTANYWIYHHQTISSQQTLKFCLRMSLYQLALNWLNNGLASQISGLRRTTSFNSLKESLHAKFTQEISTLACLHWRLFLPLYGQKLWKNLFVSSHIWLIQLNSRMTCILWGIMFNWSGPVSTIHSSTLSVKHFRRLAPLKMLNAEKCLIKWKSNSNNNGATIIWRLYTNWPTLRLILSW